MLRREKGTKTILMDEGDFGITLMMKISGKELPEGTKARFSIRKDVAGKKEVVLNKTYPITDNSFPLCFSEEDSKKIPSGNYTYCVELSKEGTFLNTIATNEEFRVSDKEG